MLLLIYNGNFTTSLREAPRLIQTSYVVVIPHRLRWALAWRQLPQLSRKRWTCRNVDHVSDPFFLLKQSIPTSHSKYLFLHYKKSNMTLISPTNLDSHQNPNSKSNNEIVRRSSVNLLRENKVSAPVKLGGSFRLWRARVGQSRRGQSTACQCPRPSRPSRPSSASLTRSRRKTPELLFSVRTLSLAHL